MNDEALEVLRQVYDEIRPDLPWDIVEQCYRIERNYQFHEDRDVRLSKLQRLVTLAVEREMGETALGGTAS